MNPTRDTQDSSDDVKQARCQIAWEALAQDRPQEAAEALTPLAEQTTEDEEVARVWAAMMGWVDDLSHLERELRRLARVWAATPQVVLEMTRSISKAWGRQAGPIAFAPRESVIGLGVDLLDVCLSEAPPSKPDERALLFRQRATLLFWAGPLGDDRALSDLEIAVTLTPDDGAGWFQLARLHLARGRWEKAALATEQALGLGFDSLRGGWNLAVALTAYAPQRVDHTRTLKEAWQLTGHDEFAQVSITDHKGREVASGLDPLLVSIHSQMISVDEWDLTQDWCDEVVWVQPLSPCHGRLLHPTIQILPADFDDLIIWDPQPARFERIEGEERPIMSGLARLERGAAVTRILEKIKLSEVQLNTLNQLLPEGVFLYQPTAQLKTSHSSSESNLTQVSGKLCWPRTLSAQKVITCFEEAWKQVISARSAL